jgi:heme oxygenase
MKSLKAATWDAHRRLEKRLAVNDRFADLAAYRHHLAQLGAFYAAAEADWAAWLTQALPDFPSRKKAALLAEDVECLGGTAAPAATAPAVSSVAAALGGYYVLEGATLGGQVLLPVVERRLGLSATRGARYLASYGPATGQMWQRFGTAVEAHCPTPATVTQATAAAQATFLALETWLLGAAA